MGEIAWQFSAALENVEGTAGNCVRAKGTANDAGAARRPPDLSEGYYHDTFCSHLTWTA